MVRLAPAASAQTRDSVFVAMEALGSHRSYRYSPVTGGGELRIVTRDPEALKAVHEYLAFQRREHAHQH